MKNKMIVEELINFKRLAGLPIISEGGGEQGLARVLLNLVVKSGEKYFPRQIGEITVKRGGNAIKMNIKVEAYENIMKKELSALTSEEKQIIQKINSNIVEQYGTREVVAHINNITKNLDAATKIYTQKRLANELFDVETANIIRSELKGQTAVVGQAINTQNIVANEMDNGAYSVISAQEREQIEKSTQNMLRDKLKTAEEQIRLYEKMNDAQFKKMEQDLKIQVQQMDIETKRRMQPVIDRAEQAIQEAKARRAEAEAKIAEAEASGKRGANRREAIKGNIEILKRVVDAVKFITIAIVSIAVIYYLYKGAMWLKNFVTGFFGGSSSNNSSDGGLEGALN